MLIPYGMGILRLYSCYNRRVSALFPLSKIMTHRLFQVDTYKAANDEFKEHLEEKLNAIATHPDWWKTRTEEWEGAYSDMGPPVHTWLLTDRSEEEVLEIARTVCPHAEIGCIHYPIKSKSDLEGMLCAARPEEYRNIKITEEELYSRLAIEDWSFYLSYGLRGWLTWQTERNNALEEKREWNPSFPTEIQFSEEKLVRLFKKAENLKNIWEWDLPIPSKTNLLAMVGIAELIQIAKFECDIEFPEGEDDVDGETLLDAILWKLDDLNWKASEGHEKPQVVVIFQDPGMMSKPLELSNIRRLKEVLATHAGNYTRASVEWGDKRFYFWHELGEKEWRGNVSQP